MFFFLRLLISLGSEEIAIYSLMSLLYVITNNMILFYIFRICSLQFRKNNISFELTRYIVSYIAGFVTFALFYSITSVLGGFESQLWKTKNLLSFSIEILAFNTFLMLVHNFVMIKLDQNNKELEITNLKLKNSEASNLRLRQQIQPHFLFNSLNTIKVLYKDDPAAAEEYLVQLSEFLRSSIKIDSSGISNVEKEIEIFENYLNMQKIRFSEAIQWNINIEKNDVIYMTLPSFSLQPLAVNAIKHNIFSPSSPLQISIYTENNFLIIQNNISKKKYDSNTIGTGLFNLSERYEMMSGHKMQIEETLEYFMVKFKLN